jgi:hypothetical protein
MQQVSCHARSLIYEKALAMEHASGLRDYKFVLFSKEVIQMAKDAQSKDEEIADFLGLKSLSEAQLDDVVAGARSFGDIVAAYKPSYDAYRKNDAMSPKDAMKAVYENNLSADDKAVVKIILQFRGIDIN